MNIPIKALKELAKKYGYDHVICFATMGEMQYVATYGDTIKACDEAAEFGNKMKDGLGWPANLRATPSRVVALQKLVQKLSAQIEGFENFHARAMKLLRKHKNFLVVAEDEPYYMEVYDLIRANEEEKDTWSEADEHFYQNALLESRKP